MKNNKIRNAIISLVIIILLIFLGSYINFVSNNTDISSNYSNIGIDKNLLNILFLDVGQADSTLITINGYAMLIDGGNISDGYYIVDFLKTQGIYKIDYLIGTHIDEDHIGGFSKIIQELDVETIYMPYSTKDKKFYKDLQTTITNKNLKIGTIEASDTINYTLGNANWKVLHVDNRNPANDNKLNDTSIVIEVEYGNTKYLFMGDSSTKVEQSRNWNKVDVLKVAHHGSNTSTSSVFLNEISPQYAIISTNGRYDTPDKEVLSRLSGIKTLRTDTQHTIWLTSDGSSASNINIKFLDFNLDGAGRKISYENIFRYVLFSLDITYYWKQSCKNHLVIAKVFHHVYLI